LGAGYGARPALKVAVIPFRNASGTLDAGNIATYLFIHELKRSDIFEPVEPGLVREVLINERTLPQAVGPEVMGALRQELGADLVVLGVVETHRDEKGQGPADSTLAASLLTTRGGTLLWTGESHVSALDTGHVFQIGRLRTADQVARRAAAELVRRMEEAAIARKDLIL
jgi:hypothetical protein